MIALTDRVGLNATGAGWAYAADSGTWRFILFTSLVDTKGALWIWERLARAFAKLRLPDGMTLLDITVASPDEDLYPASAVEVGNGTPEGSVLVPASGVADLDYGIDRMWLLRFRPRSDVVHQPAGQEAIAREFDARVSRLLAA